MSGLALIFNRNGKAAESRLVLAMLESVPHRGPDGRWVQPQDTVCLGYAKLAITPEEVTEVQPLVSRATGCMIVADARIDNRSQLTSDLALDAQASDAELILRAYEKWGTEAPRHLLGDFSFAIWDPSHVRLVCARDPSAQKPFYYRVTDARFVGGSEVQQLLLDSDVAARPNLQRIHEMLVPFNMAQNERDHPDTYFEGIKSIPAGHVLIVGRETLRLERYWTLDPPPPIRYRNPLEYAEHFRDLLAEAVKCRLRSAAPVAATLSGGLDSSSIVCMAQELLGGAVRPEFETYSFVFGDLDCDERQRILDVKRKYELTNAHLIQSPENAGWLYAGNGFQESPTTGVPGFRDALYGTAARSGARVMLTGEIADACVCGSPYIWDSLLRQGRLAAFVRQFARFRRIKGNSSPLRRDLALNLAAPLLPMWLQRWAMTKWVRREHSAHQETLAPWWMPQTLRRTLVERHLHLALSAEKARRFSNPGLEREYRMLASPEVGRDGAPYSIDIWRPFADRRLHSFLLAVPSESKYRLEADSPGLYSGSKQLIRKGLKGILPESISGLQRKTHFGSAFTNSVHRQWSEYERRFNGPSASQLEAHGLVDRDRFWKRLLLLRDGFVGTDLIYLITIISIESWLQGLASDTAAPHAARMSTTA